MMVPGDGILEKPLPPIGWRFVPTDEELITGYLLRKVARRSVPATIMQEIDASEFYSHHPRDLVDEKVCDEGYFFVHHARYFHGEIERTRMVGDGIGLWRFGGREEPIGDANGGHIFGWKIESTFFSTQRSLRRTSWTMDEFRLNSTHITTHHQQALISFQELPREEWVVARIRRRKH